LDKLKQTELFHAKDVMGKFFLSFPDSEMEKKFEIKYLISFNIFSFYLISLPLSLLISLINRFHETRFINSFKYLTIYYAALTVIYLGFFLKDMAGGVGGSQFEAFGVAYFLIDTGLSFF